MEGFFVCVGLEAEEHEVRRRDIIIRDWKLSFVLFFLVVARSNLLEQRTGRARSCNVFD